MLPGFVAAMSEPECAVEVPWELPLPAWVPPAMLLYDLVLGAISTAPELLWTAAQLLILTRMEFLSIALIVPFIIGKHQWVSTQEYRYGVIAFLVRALYIAVSVLLQLRRVSPHCVERVQQLNHGY